MKTDSKRLSEIKRVYEEGAATFLARTTEEIIAKNWWDVVEMREKFLSFILPKSTILDVGCGTGRDAKYFVQEGHDVVGIDICETFILDLQNTTRGQYFIGDIVDISSPVYQEKYDAIWSNASLVHLSRDESIQVIKNCFLSLREWWILFVGTKYDANSTHMEEKESKSIPGSIKTYLYYTESDLKKDLEQVWFQILESWLGQGAYWGDQFIRIYCKK